jgi:uncharacterized protein (TIRG00374 family)
MLRWPKSHPRELAGSLSSVAPGLLALGTTVFLLANAVSVFKWRIILRAQQVETPFLYLTTLFYIGLFFNNFLPTSFGGDVVKAYKLSKTTGRAVEAASSVVMDRATSILAMLLMAMPPALIKLSLLGVKAAMLVFIMLAVLLVITAIVASERTARRLGQLRLFSSDPLGLRRHLVSFYYSLHQLQKQRGIMAAVLLVSLIYQALSIIIVYFLALSLGIHLSLLYYFLFIPIVLAVGMIPISLNGLGMREGAWVLLFGQVGVSPTNAFSMSILSLLVMTTVSLLGGIFYLFDRASSSAPTASIKITTEETSHGQS